MVKWLLESVYNRLVLGMSMAMGTTRERKGLMLRQTVRASRRCQRTSASKILAAHFAFHLRP